MKKIILTSLILATALFAGNSAKFTNAPIYIDYSYGIVLTENGDLGGDEPMQNIVGGNSIRQELEIGKQIEEKSHIYKIFLYGWLNKKKNKERGLGIGAKWSPPIMKNIPLKLLFTAKAGLGEQAVSGKTFIAETNSNTLTTVFGGLQHGSFNATYLTDTTVIEMGLGMGLVYDISKDLSVSTEYTYLHHYYDYDYMIEGNQMSSHLSGVVQSNHYFKVSIAYKF